MHMRTHEYLSMDRKTASIMNRCATT